MADDFFSADELLAAPRSAPPVAPSKGGKASPAPVPVEASPESFDADTLLAAPRTVPDTSKNFSLAEIPRAVGDAAKNAAASAFGIPGSVLRGGMWLRDRAETLGHNLIDPGEQTPEQVGDAVKARTRAKQTPEDAAGDAFSIAGHNVLPTMQGARKFWDGAIPQLMDKPHSPTGQKVSQVLEPGFGAAMVPGGWAGRVMGGLGAVAGTEAGKPLGYAIPNSWVNGVTRYTGMTPDEVRDAPSAGLGVVGGGLYRAKGNKEFPGGLGLAEQKIADARAKGEVTTNANPRAYGDQLTMDELRETGLPRYFGATPQELQLLKSSIRTPEDAALFDALNQRITRMQGNVLGDIPDNIHQHLGIPAPTETAGQAHLRAADRVQQQNNASYNRIMSMPEAQNVWSAGLRRTLEKINNFNPQYHADVSRLAGATADAPEGARVIAPEFRAGREGNPAVRTISPDENGVMTVGHDPGEPAGFHGDQAPNLRYFDEMQKRIRYDIEQGRLPPSELDALRRLRTELLDQLNTRVDGYGRIRGEAHEMFGDRDSIAAGSDLYSRQDSFDQAKLGRAMRNMTPDQVYGLQHGYSDALAGDMARYQHNPAPILRRLQDPAYRGTMETLYGPDAVANLERQIDLQQRISRARTIAPEVSGRPRQPFFTSLRHGVSEFAMPLIAGEATFGEFLPDILHSVDPALAVHALPAVAGATAAKVGAGMARRMQDSKAAAAIVKHYSMPPGTNDAPSLPAPMQRIEPPMNRLPPPPSNEPRLDIVPERKTGGEVGARGRGKINVDSMADQLVKQVDQARAMLSGETQNILSKPDTHVVQALSVAKKALA